MNGAWSRSNQQGAIRPQPVPRCCRPAGSPNDECLGDVHAQNATAELDSRIRSGRSPSELLRCRGGAFGNRRRGKPPGTPAGGRDWPEAAGEGTNRHPHACRQDDLSPAARWLRPDRPGFRPDRRAQAWGRHPAVHHPGVRGALADAAPGPVQRGPSGRHGAHPCLGKNRRPEGGVH
ncbi:hypothetical protein D9M70_568360 [compost metagenome]